MTSERVIEMTSETMIDFVGIPRLSPRGQYLFKSLEQGPDLGLGKALAVGVDFRRQRRKGVHEGGENLFKFWKSATKRTNSFQVCIQSEPAFRLVFPDRRPVVTSRAGSSATGSVMN